MDLLSIVVQPTWREFITDLVSTNQMDPWDLDLVEIADKYLQKVRELSVLDLRVPANIILASALLLRFKAEALTFEEEKPAEEFFEERQLVSEDIPELVMRTNRPRNRRVTLDELLSAVEQVLKEGSKRNILSVPKILSLEVPLEDMGERMAKIYRRAVSSKDAEGVLTFSSLLHNGHCTGNGSCQCVNAEAMVSHLLPVLHLVQDNKVLVWQEALFGEIFLRVLAEGGQASEQVAVAKAS